MEPGVGAEEAELAPAFVDVRGGGLLEAADVVAPETEAAASQGQTAPQGLRHGGVARGAVAAPVGGELLAAYRGRPGKEHRFPLATLAFQQLKHRPVIQEGVAVVHGVGIGAIEPANAPHGNALAEVRFEAVHAHVQQCFQLGSVPGRRLGVGKVHQGHPRLPQVRLPDVPVFLFHQEALVLAFLEQMGHLTDVGIDPHADLKALLMIAPEHPGGVREGVRVPDKVAPAVGPHPIAVEVEHPQGDIPVRHALNEGGGGFLVVIGGKGGGQPQSEGPGGGQSGHAGEPAVFAHRALGAASGDDVIAQGLSGNGELDVFYLLAGDLEFQVAKGVHQHAVALAGDVEGDIFIGLLAGGTPVLVPDGHGLPVFHEGGKPLAQTVDALADVDGQLLHHEALPGVPVQHPGLVAVAGGGQTGRSIIVVNIPAGGRFADPGLQRSAAVDQMGIRLGDLHLGLLGRHLRTRRELSAPGKMGDLRVDDVFLGRGKGHRQDAQVQAVSPVSDVVLDGIDRQGIAPDLVTGVFHGVDRGDALLQKPESVGKFHILQPSFLGIC